MGVEQVDGTYVIEPDANTVHSVFSRDLKPIATVEPGACLRFRTLDAAGQVYDAETDSLKRVESIFANNPLRGHALCGPIAVAGAKKGMTLEVVIDAIETAEMGWNRGGSGVGWPHGERLGVDEDPPHKTLWRIADGRATMSHTGYSVPIAPFMGVLGMPPNRAGKFDTSPPRDHGGNIDCKLLTAGSRLFLPVSVDGALFSVGDGHAAQGDGEASGTAIECPMRQ
ncbi:MAG: acetamidase/formamidase family protein, partial [Chloroflexota bacterium]